MSEDRREAILARMVEVAKTVVPEDNVFRNQVSVPEGFRPAIVILDGDEGGEDDARVRNNLQPSIMAMLPEVHILASGHPDTVDMPGDKIGAKLNDLRRLTIKAFLSDESLVALCHDGRIRYDGMATGLAAGRSMEGEANLSFTLWYVLRPAKL